MSQQQVDLLQPITADRPGGENLRYDPKYEEVKRARIEEADLPTGDWGRERKTANWPLVIQITTELLARRTKDLQLAAWLTEAWLKRDGFAGLGRGLTVLRSLLTEFWDGLYPEIEDDDLEFRAAPLAWIGEYLGPAVRMQPITSAGYDTATYRDSRAVGYEQDADSYDQRESRKAAIEAGRLTAEEFDDAIRATPKAWYRQLIADIDDSLAALDQLDATASERFGRDAPRFAVLRGAIQDVRKVAAQLLAMKLENDPDPAVDAPLVATAPNASGETGMDAASDPAQGEAAAVRVEGGAPQGAGVVSDAVGVMPGVAGVVPGAAGVVPGAAVTAGVQAAGPLRSRADAENRIAAAAHYLREQDPTDPSSYLLLRGFRWGELRARGATVDPRLLEAPPTHERAGLRGMMLDGRWADLLETGERMMATPYGRGWLDLQRYILSACAGLGSEYDVVARAIEGALGELLGAVPDLASLTLMDDTPTANAETQAWLAGLGLTGDAAPDRPMAGSAGGTRGVHEQAMEKVRSGEPDRAIDLLIQQAARERSPRDRYLRRTQAAAIMVASGREAIALPILEELLGEIEEHGLEAWESGDIVAEPMSLLHQCMQRLDGDSSTMQQLYLRICRLDPVRAMNLPGHAAQ
jgi:type VI secretion system protein ImpA